MQRNLTPIESFHRVKNLFWRVLRLLEQISRAATVEKHHPTPCFWSLWMSCNSFPFLHTEHGFGRHFNHDDPLLEEVGEAGGVGIMALMCCWVMVTFHSGTLKESSTHSFWLEARHLTLKLHACLRALLWNVLEQPGDSVPVSFYLRQIFMSKHHLFVWLHVSILIFKTSARHTFHFAFMIWGIKQKSQNKNKWQYSSVREEPFVLIYCFSTWNVPL